MPSSIPEIVRASYEECISLSCQPKLTPKQQKHLCAIYAWRKIGYLPRREEIKQLIADDYSIQTLNSLQRKRLVKCIRYSPKTYACEETVNPESYCRV